MHPKSPLLLVMLLLAPSTAGAHIGLQPDGIDMVHPPGGGTPLDFESTFALFRSDDGEEWSLTCHEALLLDPMNPSNQLPRYARSDDALLVTLRSLGLGFSPDVDVYYSTDGGCDWTATQGLTNRTVAALAVLADGSTVVAGSADQDVDNGLFYSLDGADFDDSDAVAIDGLVLSVEPGPDGVAWATSLSPTSASVWRSLDGGATWESHDFLFPEGGALQDFVLPMAHPTDPLIAWVRAQDASQDYVYRTLDGGETFDEVYRGSLRVTDGVVCGAQTVLTRAGGSPLASADAGETFAIEEDWPSSQGAACVDGSVTFALNVTEDDTVAQIVDGAPAYLMGYGDVVSEMSCPAGSRHAQVCGPLWEAACQVLDLYREDRICSSGDDDDDSVSDDDDPGDDDDCACSAPATDTPAAASLLALGLGLGLARRRRS
ncbi:MAG: hypothetical protein KDA24_08810 [Deltaproteobacteria bacterium]|nr:hypothetical protein [Deltaproteobacteria bacterium]